MICETVTASDIKYLIHFQFSLSDPLLQFLERESSTVAENSLLVRRAWRKVKVLLSA